MNTEMIRPWYESYQESLRILAANHTTVAERKAAIQIRDEFLREAPKMIRHLLSVVQQESAY